MSDDLQFVKAPDGKVTINHLGYVDSAWQALLVIAVSDESASVRMDAAERIIRLGAEFALTMPPISTDLDKLFNRSSNYLMDDARTGSAGGE